MALTIRISATDRCPLEYRQPADVEIDEAKSVCLRYLKKLHEEGVQYDAASVLDECGRPIATLEIGCLLAFGWVGADEHGNYRAAWTK